MPQDPFYSSKQWRETRAKYLAAHPFCKVCAQIGIRARAQEVDHIVAIKKGGHPFAFSNLQGLCKTHHSQKTIYIDGQHKAFNKQLIVTGPDGFPLEPTERK